MTTTATRTGSLPNHVDDDGRNRYVVHTDQQGRIKPFDSYASAAWYDDEPKAALWSAQQFCVHIMDNELGTCPFRDRLNVFYTDLMFALRGNGRIDKNSLIGRYNAFVTEYNSTFQPATANDPQVAPVVAAPVVTSQPAPASQPATVVERDVAASTTPRPAPAAEPVVTTPVREPAPQPTRVDERDDNGAPIWLTEFREEFGGKVTNHDTTLYGENGDAGLVNDVIVLRADVDELRAAIPRGSDGKYSFESFRNTIRTRGIGYMIASIFGAFIGTFLMLLIVVAFLGLIFGYGAIAAVSTWIWLITLVAAIVAILVAIHIHRANTASAVTREERN
jgi:hypothetical protein